MTYRERIAAIRAMGYTPREAGFLELVALQSGYFLRRQYNLFLDRPRGGTAAALIRKLLQKGHVSVESSCTRTPIYRLRRRAFYERIGEPNNRHRRRRGTVAIASSAPSASDLVADIADDSDVDSSIISERDGRIDLDEFNVVRHPELRSRVADVIGRREGGHVRDRVPTSTTRRRSARMRSQQSNFYFVRESLC